MSGQSIAETFRIEADEILETLEQGLHEFDAGNDDPEILNAIFRAAHTLKGSALIAERRDVGELAHVIEELFVRWRDARLAPTPSQTRWALQSVDVLRALLSGEACRTKQDRDATTDTGSHQQRMLRVAQSSVDSMLTTIGELVLAHGRMAASVVDVPPEQQPKLHDILEGYARLHAVLREDVMKLRLVPLAPLLSRMRATAHEAARKLGKDIDFVVEGTEHALDTSLVEGMCDPFMHLVRNAVDHGIEPEAVRLDRGKPARGCLRLRVEKSAGTVVMTLEDDGRGLDRARIEQKARERGLYPKGVTLTPSEVDALIFEPGFSTAEKVTEISGRGVGMDVVRRNIQALRGTITVSSELGRGTSFSISLPLDLSILDGTLVEAEQQQFIVPDERVLEFVDVAQPSAAALSTLDVRGQTLPCIRLSALFGEPPAPERQTALVLSHATGRIGLMIDRSHGTQQLVIRPVGPLLRSLPIVAGAAVLGSGDVALLLDIDKLVGAATQRAARDGISLGA